jgi:hypothetical protein
MTFRLTLLIAALGLAAESRGAVGVRVLMGLTDQNSSKWDGSAAAPGARIAKIDPWRFDVEQASSGALAADSIRDNTWILSTHRARNFGASTQFVPNGVIVWLEDETEATELDIKTAQGNFRLRLSDIPYGKGRKYLDNRVFADRIPPSWQITNSPDEQDYPAVAADRDGNLWLAYIEFRHNPDHDRIRHLYFERPANFDDMKAAPGGDQVLLRKFSANRWGPPIAITPPGGDLYRPSIAVDGSGRPWVFWSENRKGNFDVWARAIDSGKPGRTVQISREPGSDIDPAAATDAKGRVWVAWQGWRNGKASVFAATQEGDRFSAPAVVSSSSGNEWDPAIAADREGHVAVAWDSYRNGNYDIYCRTATAPGAWGKEIAVADSPRYEAYPSIAYAPDGKLWIAYEEGSERWGKDYGAHDTSGYALYAGRAVRLVAIDRAGQRVTTRDDAGDVLPGFPAGAHPDAPPTQNAAGEWTKLNPDAAKGRKPNGEPQGPRSPKNSLPRLTVDASGRLWLAFRAMFPVRWSVIGSVWTEYLVSYDCNSWTGPVYLAHSDNLLDNRPAVISMKPGQVVVIGSSDGRANFPAGLPDLDLLGRILRHIGGSKVPAAALTGGPTALMGNPAAKDPYNNDLYAAVLSLAPSSSPVAVKSAPPLGRAADPDDPIEKAALERMRGLRVRDGSSELRVVRGEFHRHSELSVDGGIDGTLLDQWRYMIDAGGMDWVGCCDHENGGGREYSWWITQKQTDIFYSPGKFAPMFSYERSVPYPEGHRNVLFVQRGIRTLPRLPKVDPETPGHAPDTQMFYAYLKQFDGVVASHTSATNMGTDWRDNDPNLEPVVEIYQGIRQSYEMPGAPRTNTEGDSIGGWRPQGFINLALQMGFKMGFQASSDHVSTHQSYCNILVTDNTREAILAAVKQRHVYGATDNILADVRSGSHLMGDAFATAERPELKVKLIGTKPFAKVHVIKDNEYVYSTEPKTEKVEFTWRDSTARQGKTSYYYVRGEQEDGELVWVSPMWITYR